MLRTPVDPVDSTSPGSSVLVAVGSLAPYVRPGTVRFFQETE